MEVGDPVTLSSDPNAKGVVTRVPRSEGRKRARALVKFESGEAWVFQDELKKYEPLEGE